MQNPENFVRRIHDDEEDEDEDLYHSPSTMAEPSNKKLKVCSCITFPLVCAHLLCIGIST